MSEPPSTRDALAAELDRFTLTDATNWLREVVRNREYRLSGRQITSGEGLRGARLWLPKTARDLLEAALTEIATEWLSETGRGWSDEATSEMLYLVRDFRPQRVRTHLENLFVPFLEERAVQGHSELDALSSTAQTLILEILGDWPPVSTEFWRKLAATNPDRFALHAFYSLAPVAWADALHVLCVIPGTMSNLRSLSFSAEWIESTIPPNGQASYLFALANALHHADAAVSRTIQETLKDNGVELSFSGLSAFDWAAVYTVSKRELRPRDPLGSRE